MTLTPYSFMMLVNSLLRYCSPLSHKVSYVTSKTRKIDYSMCLETVFPVATRRGRKNENLLNQFNINKTCA